MEHVDGEAWGHDTTITVLAPIDGKGIEVVALEVHHREEGVHQSIAQPALRILAHGGVGIPTRTLIAREVVELADGRAGEHHPGFDGFNGAVDLSHDIGDILAALIATHLEFPRLWIADIVEMNAIDIVTAGNFGTETGQIIARLRTLRVHITFVAYLLNQVGESLADLFTTIGVPLAHRDGDNPRMALHAALVALVDTELQRVVARRLARGSRDTDIPWFFSMGEDDGGSDTRLEHDGIDIGLAQLVENVDELLALLVGGVGAGPVDAANGGEPYGSDFMFGSLR